ncbi:MAG: fluoride efflux transporter CrcB [Actinobacteria bacterium]|nr:fluoride efflux transporter CrcB [Actinomycetota bacterium]
MCRELRTHRGVGAVTALAWVAVGALGGAMAIARFLLDTTVARRLGGTWLGDDDFPVGTLAVNLSGAVVLGVLAGAALSGTAYTILAGGGVGTYTTFSTWMLESHRAGEDGAARVLWLNIAVSLVAGLAAVALGHWIGGLL